MVLPPMGPDGYPPDVWAALDHDRNTAPVIAVTATCLGLALLVVALRVYTRRVLLDNFGLDDWFAVFSLVRAPPPPPRPCPRRGPAAPAGPHARRSALLLTTPTRSRWPSSPPAPSSSCTRTTGSARTSTTCRA